jgi:hypothetical protein
MTQVDRSTRVSFEIFKKERINNKSITTCHFLTNIQMPSSSIPTVAARDLLRSAPPWRNTANKKHLRILGKVTNFVDVEIFNEVQVHVFCCGDESMDVQSVAVI